MCVLITEKYLDTGKNAGYIVIHRYELLTPQINI